MKVFDLRGGTRLIVTNAVGSPPETPRRDVGAPNESTDALTGPSRIVGFP